MALDANGRIEEDLTAPAEQSNFDRYYSNSKPPPEYLTGRNQMSKYSHMYCKGAYNRVSSIYKKV